MGNTKSAEKKGIGALNWTLLLVIGFSAQIAWVIENNWFANFLYSDFGAQLGVVTAMTICSATATTFSALFFGTLSDRIGSRKKLITWGSILWGIFTIAFGLTHYLRDSIYNDVMLVGVTIVAADTIMSFFGSMANDAGYNAWYADMMDDSNSGQIGAVAATLPVIGTLVGTLVGGMFVTGLATEANPQAGYIIFFSVAGGVTVLVGIASFFLLKDAPTLKPVKDGGFWHQFGSTFNFRRFAANRELALVFLTLCIFFIGYNCYFIHIMNWMNYTLGFTDPSLILGIPLLIARPEIELTMLDSTGKKLAFVSQSVEDLGLSANVVHARAEEAGRGELRESFDFAVSRAVAAMNVLCEYCLPFVRVGGTFCAMKGAKGSEELGCAEKTIAVLGGETKKTESFILPDGGERVLINVKKISHTATKYPRPSAQISKKPLI